MHCHWPSLRTRKWTLQLRPGPRGWSPAAEMSCPLQGLPRKKQHGPLEAPSPGVVCYTEIASRETRRCLNQVSEDEGEEPGMGVGSEVPPQTGVAAGTMTRRRSAGCGVRAGDGAGEQGSRRGRTEGRGQKHPERASSLHFIILGPRFRVCETWTRSRDRLRRYYAIHSPLRYVFASPNASVCTDGAEGRASKSSQGRKLAVQKEMPVSL